MATIADFKPQLAESIDLLELPTYANDEEYVFESKFDGVRCCVKVSGDVRLLNRQGEPKLLFRKPTERMLVSEFRRLGSGPFILDGELVDETLWVFDVPFAGNIIGPHHPFKLRRDLLVQLFKVWKPDAAIQLVESASSRMEKLNMAKTILGEGGEGVIVKHINAPYRLGKRSVAWKKAKFVKQIDCVIVDKGRNGKDNMTVAVFDDGALIELCDVSALTGDGPRTQIGDVVTVTYLGVKHADRPRLTQPVKPILRTDKRPEECTIDQLPGRR